MQCQRNPYNQTVEEWHKSQRLLEFRKPRNHGDLKGQALMKEMGLDILKCR